MNTLKTAALLGLLSGLLLFIGEMLGGAQGLVIAFGFALVTNVVSYWFSDKIVLKMYNAREVDERSAPEFYRMIRELTQTAQLPMPKVYIIDEAQPNAFATGRNPENAAVAATTGIMRILSERELRGVMAHELAHVRNRDTLISTISASIAGAISSFAHFGLLFGGGRDRDVHPALALLVMILAPIAAMLIQMAISRSREFEADRTGAEISNDPDALASALRKIHNYAHQIPMDTVEQHPETAQMMIINPLSGGGIRGLFSTHPDVEERIARLMSMAA